ncbi:hypothetical protein JOF42_003215 [Microbacterium phyllosphaerae]|uniref:Uncharacterized protein n=1 Tax=Microbacterium phyllosphaerae TaxID=124798 RepID=A0ABS4WU52_9MICO|nr:hypothetical protein [Microbacterium phyllosphaerae]
MTAAFRAARMLVPEVKVGHTPLTLGEPRSFPELLQRRACA